MDINSKPLGKLTFLSGCLIFLQDLGAGEYSLFINNLLSGISASWLRSLWPALVCSLFHLLKTNGEPTVSSETLIFQGGSFFPLRPICLFLWQFRLLCFSILTYQKDKWTVKDWWVVYRCLYVVPQTRASSCRVGFAVSFQFSIVYS